jgi:hypothetical protein
MTSEPAIVSVKVWDGKDGELPQEDTPLDDEL